MPLLPTTAAVVVVADVADSPATNVTTLKSCEINFFLLYLLVKMYVLSSYNKISVVNE